MKKIKSVPDILKVRRMFVPKVGGAWPDPACFIGLEIEAENIVFLDRETGKRGSPTSSVEYLNSCGWSMVADGSLRGDGREFRFTEPLLGEHLTQSIASFFSSVRFTPSARAGIHIHVDWTAVEDATSVSKLVAILYALEPALFAIGGGGRKECVYCKPLTDIPVTEMRKLLTSPAEKAFTDYMGGAIVRGFDELMFL
jgi:hypothetical protein